MCAGGIVEWVGWVESVVNENRKLDLEFFVNVFAKICNLCQPATSSRLEYHEMLPGDEVTCIYTRDD